MKASWKAHKLEFTFEAGTSRGKMHHRKTWYIILQDESRVGIGECAPLEGLSTDDFDGLENHLQWVCDHIDEGFKSLYEASLEYPSIQMGLEMAFLSLRGTDTFSFFSNPYTLGKAGIPINGLVWMSDATQMRKQIKSKIDEGYTCIKIKIGALNIADEIALIEEIREKYEPWEVEIRLDANGAFTEDNVWDILDELAPLEIHSLEQPVQPQAHSLLRELCAESPIPIALDESLIGIRGLEAKKKILSEVLPDYIVIKPSLLGGFRAAEDWISAAESEGIGWWITSALESNIGLHAIAQWAGNYPLRIHQGLGTGSLYSNNIASPLQVKKGKLFHQRTKEWVISDLL